MADARVVQALQALQFVNVAELLDAAAEYRVPPEYLVTLANLESTRGHHVFGHDQRDGVLAYPYAPGDVNVEVTETGYAQYRASLVEGKPRNGIGPLQVTHHSLQDDPQFVGVLWQVREAIRCGAQQFAWLLARYGDTGPDGAFARYRGLGDAGTAYAAKAMALLPRWRAVIEEATSVAGELLIPFAEHRLDGTPNGTCWPSKGCVHTSVTSAPAPAAHVSVLADGRLIQHRPADVASAANLNGNPYVFAFECMDKGPEFPPHDDGSNTLPPLTGAQCESLARAFLWLHQQWGIALEFVHTSLPGTGGFATHRAGIDGNFSPANGFAFPGRVLGGVLWSAILGKICPRDVRIFQVRDVIMPRARALAGLETIVTTLDDTFEVSYKGAIVQKVSYASAIHNIFKILFYGSESPPWTGPSLITEARDTRAAVALLGDDEQKILAAIASSRTAESGQLAAAVQTLIEAEQSDTVGLSEAQMDAFVQALVAATPAPVTPAEIEAALRRVFGDASTADSTADSTAAPASG